MEGFTTIWLFDIFTLFISLRSEGLLIKLLLRIKKQIKAEFDRKTLVESVLEKSEGMHLEF